MTLRRFLSAVPALLAMALLAGCYYPPPQAYAPYPPCAPVANPDGTTSASPNCYGYAPYAAYPAPYYYPYPAYYSPYYGYPPVAVGVGFGFGFRGRFR
ncbi:MAG TPA: hypothetical protein VGP50_00095 [Stellaceae bacterium]|jgi:hypothetical protein|nr:hypothetical protein [Stellaceae bacterium]